MDIITRITRQRGKMQIVISEQETIVVPLSLFRERPLTEGQPINLEEYDNWLMVRQYRHALDRAVACLAARAHSKHEIEQKLLRVGYRPCTVEMVLYKLEREHLLNDADFARQWVEARSGRKLGHHEGGAGAGAAGGLTLDTGAVPRYNENILRKTRKGGKHGGKSGVDLRGEAG